MGKTSLVMNIAVNVALQGLGAYVFSVEMPNDQLAMRAICAEARVNLSKARSNAFAPGDWPKLTEATLRLATPELSPLVSVRGDLTNYLPTDRPAASSPARAATT